MNKPQKTQPKTHNNVQDRDKFYTPNYGTDLVIPYINGTIWEPACGTGKMVKRFHEKGINAFGTDLEGGYNFLTHVPGIRFDMIATNPPFSLKQEFYNTCKSFDVPFALLIPLDFCGWILRAMKDDGAQWIAPTRRIDYITPTGKSGKTSNPQFHSGWFCVGLNLPQQITVVELTLEMKKNI